MDAKRQLLLQKIEQAIELLDKYYEETKGYCGWLRQSAELIKAEDPYGIHHFLNIYSDIDSMDKIHFDTVRVNQEFQQLVVEMHELAKMLKKEQDDK